MQQNSAIVLALWVGSDLVKKVVYLLLSTDLTPLAVSGYMSYVTTDIISVILIGILQLYSCVQQQLNFQNRIRKKGKSEEQEGYMEGYMLHVYTSQNL